MLTIAALWIFSIQSLFRRESSQDDEFSVQNVFEKMHRVFVYRMARNSFFYDQERLENDRNHRMPKGWLWLSAGKPGRIMVAAAAASCGVLTKSFFEKKEQHV